jgi:hypothetical protein
MHLPARLYRAFYRRQVCRAAGNRPASPVPCGPSNAASCAASSKANAGFYPKKGTIYALWLGDSGSVAAVAALGTLCARIETMKTSGEQLSLRFRLDLPSGRPGDDARLEPELMAALAAKGADIMESGVCDRGPWGAKLLANFGEEIAEKVRGHLPELYAASQDELRKRQGGVRSPEQACADGTASAPQSRGETERAVPVAVSGEAVESPVCHGRGTGEPPPIH